VHTRYLAISVTNSLYFLIK